MGRKHGRSKLFTLLILTRQRKILHIDVVHVDEEVIEQRYIEPIKISNLHACVQKSKQRTTVTRWERVR
jgi:hypothetical protein